MTSADCHGAVLIGDFLSWDSADYKLSEALSNLEIVQEVLLLQLDEVAVDLDLFRLQMRNFDPDTVMVSIRTKAFEYMAQEVQRVIHTETRLGHRAAVLFFHLQAQGIPAGQRAFANAVVTRADGSQHYDKFVQRIGALLEPAPLYVDEGIQLRRLMTSSPTGSSPNGSGQPSTAVGAKMSSRRTHVRQPCARLSGRGTMYWSWWAVAAATRILWIFA
jgi:hypothetical protein